MRILYIKRAYNTRLHTQVHALRERGHSITLLLEAPIEYGYSGRRQWEAEDIYSRFRVYYSWPSQTYPNRQKILERLALKALNKVHTPKWSRHSWILRKWFFQQSLDQVISMHPIDLIISGNDAIEKEDYRTKLVIDRMTGTVPIVYDCQDFLSDCFDRDLKGKVIERFVNENADAVIHTNPVGFDWIASKYKIRRGFVFSNFTSQKYFVNKQPKLSDRDGRTHLVYCGGVQQTPGGSLYPVARDMRRMFTNIAKLGFPLHLHLGLYPETSLCQYYMTLRDSPNIIMHPYLPYEDMMQTLSRYDIGLFPVDLGPLQKELEHLGPGAMEYSPLSRIDTSKQYEYTMAGLPVLSRPVKWISAWLEGNGFGTHFISVSHLGELLRGKDLQGFAQSVARNARKFSIENQIEELEDFLFDVLGESRKKSKGKMKG